MKKIEEVLPHRDPFLFLDEITEIGSREVTTIKKFTDKDYFFRGHFPSEPVVPGVIINEIFAQSAAYLVLSKNENFDNSYLVGINQSKFMKKIVPGDIFETNVKIKKKFDNIFTFIASGVVSKKEIASAEIIIAFK